MTWCRHWSGVSGAGGTPAGSSICQGCCRRGPPEEVTVVRGDSAPPPRRTLYPAKRRCGRCCGGGGAWWCTAVDRVGMTRCSRCSCCSGAGVSATVGAAAGAAGSASRDASAEDLRGPRLCSRRAGSPAESEPVGTARPHSGKCAPPACPRPRLSKCPCDSQWTRPVAAPQCRSARCRRPPSPQGSTGTARRGGGGCGGGGMPIAGVSEQAVS